MTDDLPRFERVDTPTEREKFLPTGKSPDRGPLTSTRSKARRAALDLLYEAEQRGMNAAELLAERLEHPVKDGGLRPYTTEVVRGVVEHWSAIDDALATYAQGWEVSRMPAVDRALLRMAVWEIVYNDDVPDAVAASEAAALAGLLSTDESAGFVTGLLTRIIDVKPTLV